MSIDTDVTTDETTDDTSDRPALGTIGEPARHPTTVEVRRRPGIAVALGAGASLVAVAYLARAVERRRRPGLGRWPSCSALIGVANLAALSTPARRCSSPTTSASACGSAAPGWGCPGAGCTRSSTGRAAAGGTTDCSSSAPTTCSACSRTSTRRAPACRAAQPRLHHAPLAVPLGLATRVVGARRDLTAALRALADGRTRSWSDVRRCRARLPRPSRPGDRERRRASEVLAAPACEAPSRVPATARLRSTPPGDRAADRRRRGPLRARRPRTDGREADVEPERRRRGDPEPVRETVAAARAEVRREAWRARPVGGGDPGLGRAPRRARDRGGGPPDRRLRRPAGRGAGDRAAVRGRPPPAGADRRPAGRPHPDPPARDRGDRGRRLQRLRRRLLRPRPPAHAGAGARASTSRRCSTTYDERYADAPIDPRRVFEAELRRCAARSAPPAAARTGRCWWRP